MSENTQDFIGLIDKQVNKFGWEAKAAEALLEASHAMAAADGFTERAQETQDDAAATMYFTQALQKEQRAANLLALVALYKQTGTQ